MTKLPKRYIQVDCPISGGFGDIICCKDQHLERKVAIKFIQDENEKKRLLDELRALLQMRSKHVVQVYDIVQGENGSIGIVEEFIEGNDLWDSDYPQQSQLNYLKTIWQIASGISDIHSAGVIHRDIKPNNMKIDLEGIVKIYDFGLARDEGKNAKTKGFRGTMGFAAPELFGNATVAFTQAIDIYAFGATAYFLSCRDLPATMKKIPPQPIVRNPFLKVPISIPDEIKDILYKCLSFDPLYRPQMIAVRNELARHLLRNKHQALAVYKGKPHVINAINKSAGLDYPGVGKIEITYDGLKFFVSVANGEVFINNSAVELGSEIPGSCVVALGGSYRRNNERAFITFDISNPEVVL